MYPSYLDLFYSGELERRARALEARLEECDLCPRRCRVNRLKDEIGYCGIGMKARIASYNLHFGEEAPLVGENGSGTIFFSGCNLRCVFCQNSEISQPNQPCGQTANPDELAGVMLDLQEQGALNLNFVTPSHVVPQIIQALPTAIKHGLRLPLVYNTSSYDNLDTLYELKGIFDLYMPDMKFFDPEPANKFMSAPDYPETAIRAIREMHAQSGDLILDKNGIAEMGLIIRHLIMPDNLAGTEQWFKFVSTEISANSYLNIMSQYHPSYMANSFSELDHSPSNTDIEIAFQLAEKFGLGRLDLKSNTLLNRIFRFLH